MPAPRVNGSDATRTTSSEPEPAAEWSTVSQGHSPFAIVQGPEAPLTPAGLLMVVCEPPLYPLPDGEHRIQLTDGATYFGEVQAGQLEGRGLVMMADGSRYEGTLSGGKAHGAGVYVAAGGGAYFGNWMAGHLHGEVVHTLAKGKSAVSMRVYDNGKLEKEEILEVAGPSHKTKASRKERKKAKETYRSPRPGEAVYRGHRSFDLVQQLQLGLTYSIAQSRSQKDSGNGDAALNGEEVKKAAIPATGSVPGFVWKDYLPSLFQALREAFGIDNGDYLLSLTGGEALRLLPSPGKSGSIFLISGDDRFVAKTVRKEEMKLILRFIPMYYKHVKAERKTLLVRFFGVHRVSPLLGRRVRFLIMQNALPTHLRLHRRYDLKGSRYGRTAGAERETKPFVTLKDLDLDVRFVLPVRTHTAVMRQLDADCALLERLNVMDYSLLLGVHFVRWGNERWSPPFGDWGAAEAEPPAPDGHTWGRGCDARSLAAILRSAEEESGLGEAVRSAASMLTRVGRTSVAAWESAVRLSLPKGDGPASAPRPQGLSKQGQGPSRPPLPGVAQRALSRQLSRVEAAAIPLQDATFARSASLLTRMQSLAAPGTGPGPGPVAAPAALDAMGSAGTAVPALAVQTEGEGAAGATPQPVLLYFAIIDFLQDYNLRKRVERAVKARFHPAADISVASAEVYAARFKAMVRDLFVPGPDIKD
ncbi:hypothetical protein APUTEX25_001076 [Auxenochlorella protothecoides]|uniref:1-phosphatidylinositol-4-phosphate 5-kinase n=1 Tax=Auxenochlorella protothecoides TaxID=3075 RepID=A0A1D1ZPZ2_AUXPR|nr:hypothetical protein APUTEX25_001076 [Auxenochlorella protothecoides]|eukprot:RMZ52957.1 hypothetical protein APUTEX25_001076 [Auxenochlorella protothecoides]